MESKFRAYLVAPQKANEKPPIQDLVRSEQCEVEWEFLGLGYSGYGDSQMGSKRDGGLSVFRRA
jgi:hypothetical protein